MRILISSIYVLPIPFEPTPEEWEEYQAFIQKRKHIQDITVVADTIGPESYVRWEVDHRLKTSLDLAMDEVALLNFFQFLKIKRT